MDWLFSRCKARQQQQLPVAGCETCTQTCSRVVASYVPYTAYRTCYEQVPVTYYRQVTSTDPCTGCTITCNRPCTSYQLQAKRVPYTAYRTVYRTETYQTPVTAAYAPCSTCATCPTCPSAPMQIPPSGYSNQNIQPYGYSNVAPATYSQIQPYGGVQIQPYGGAPGGVYGTNPADVQPTLTPGEFSESTITNYPSYPDASSYSTPAAVPDYNSPALPAGGQTDVPSVLDRPAGQEDPNQQTEINLNSPEGQNGGSAADGKQTSTRRRAITPYVDPNSQWQTTPRPAANGKTANSPLRKNWSYSPRLASYQPSRAPADIAAQPNTVQPARNNGTPRRWSSLPLNAGWKSGN
jgi:hypothetical protein